MKQKSTSGSQLSNCPSHISTPNALSPPRMKEGAYQIGLLKFCSPLVKKCYGCGQMLKIRGDDDHGHLLIPPPPHDIAIITATRRVYWQKGEQKQSNLTNVYYHCRVDCVRSKQPTFLPFLVVIPTNLQPHLLAIHRQHIAQELQITI